MELRQVRSFVVLAEALHFGRAAERLHLSTPALSQQIKSLERDLRTTLFIRDRRQVRLTEAGELFLARAEPLLTAADDAVAELRDHARGVAGHLRVGLFVNNAAELTVPILQRFRAAYPRTRIEFVPLDFAGQLSGLLEDHVDVAFVRPPLTHPGLIVHPLASEPRVVLMSRTSPYADADSLSTSDLGDAAFIDGQALQMPSSWTDFWLLEHHEQPPRPVAGGRGRLGSFDAVVVDVAVNETITTVPLSVARDVNASHVTHVRLADRDCQIAVATRADESRPLVTRFVALAFETTRELVELVPGAVAGSADGD